MEPQGEGEATEDGPALEEPVIYEVEDMVMDGPGATKRGAMDGWMT